MILVVAMLPTGVLQPADLCTVLYCTCNDVRVNNQDMHLHFGALLMDAFTAILKYLSTRPSCYGHTGTNTLPGTRLVPHSMKVA